jgi:aspartyl-tRNA(Asn)/glutamyl-tRNA(Gln) amidotransferase subunit A
MRDVLHALPARRIAQAVRAREVSARQVALHFLDRVKHLDGALRAFVDVDRELTLAHADRVDRRRARGGQLGPLAGVPVALKDNLCQRGLPTTCGSRLLSTWSPPYDADVVERLLAADAVPLGKTNLDEFGMGSSTEWSAFGATANPWDPARSPGGSSGGSAAAVAAGLVPLALGSDTGGSVRQPAAHCGVFGVAATYGRVSRRGLVAFASSLDRVGALARHADDLALLLRALSGGDPGDATSVHAGAPDWRDDVAAGVRELRIGVLAPDPAIEPGVAAACDAACRALSDAGAELRQVRLPGWRDALAAYHVIAAAEASSNLARFDGVRFGTRADGPHAEASARATRGRGFGADVRRRLIVGTLALSAGHRVALHARAEATRRRLVETFAEAFDDVAVIAGPTAPTAAFLLGSRTADPLAMYGGDVLTAPGSLAGLPAMSVPVGTADGRLPVGLQITAPALAEDRLFRVAGVLERALGPPALPGAFA